MRMDVIADSTDRGAGVMRRTQDGQCLRGRAGRPISVVDAMPAARGAKVLAQQLAGLRIKEPDMQLIPLHMGVEADPGRRRAVVGGLEFDIAITMSGVGVGAWSIS